MTGVPRNNLEEQLARYNASTLRKDSSLEKRDSRKSFDINFKKVEHSTSLSSVPSPHRPPIGSTLTKTHNNHWHHHSTPWKNSSPSNGLNNESMSKSYTEPSGSALFQCEESLAGGELEPASSKATQRHGTTHNSVVAESVNASISPRTRVPGSSLAKCAQRESACDVHTELESIQSERLSVMDDICELLTDIPSSKITAFFGQNAGCVQKKLAMRKKLLLKEESLKASVVSKPPSSAPVPTDQPSSCYSGETDSPSESYLHSLGNFTDVARSTRPLEDDAVNMIDENWDFNIDDDMFINEVESIPYTYEPPQPYDSEPPQPFNSEPVDSHGMPRSTEPSPSISAQSSRIPSLSSKKTFKPPFLHPNNKQCSMNTSFANAFDKPGMFKPSGSNAPPKDDAVEFRGQYEHTREMYKIFNQVFGLKKFRPNQHEAVNAVILRKDCFVLMPTGGGKSLCYQLPALMAPGVTIVVSPLRSLIQDQVQKLASLGIPARYLSSALSASEEGEVYRYLSLREPVIKLLYVTPEKLSASNKLMSTLQGLHNRKMLARFVIDEAHCISQWGHDFRPDYKKLSELRHKFSGVPIMALTATATPRVRADILNQLNMQNTCKWFTQSFDRINLKYIVVPKKPKKVTEDIIALIHKSFLGLSGIIYCLSRRDCEVVAGELCKANIAGLCYHAGLSDGERSTVQQRWVQGDRCKVVCATIAFGMGIDKPDVRFVIHHSLPKSVEGFYQEAGRAGRDGKPAQCILFYNYSDMARLRRMVKAEKMLHTQEKVHMDNLYRMVQYCENMADCRRVQLLEYFAENFDPSRCKNGSTPCDNCQSSAPFVTQDVTDLVKVIVQSVEQVGNAKYTLNQYMDAVKGSNSQRMSAELRSLPLFNQANKTTKHDLERLLHMLVMKDVLSESLTIGSHDNVVCYVKLGGKASDVLDGRISGIVLKVKGGGKGSSGPENTATAMSREDRLKAECLKTLHTLRLAVTTQHKLQNPEYVVSSAALQGMADLLPTSKLEMLNVEGYTELKWDRFEGLEFLKVTREYAEELSKLCTEAAASEKKSAYFKEGAKSCPVIGKGKRKQSGQSSTPYVKKVCRTPRQQPVVKLLDFADNSDDEFEEPPRKAIRPMAHPNH